MRKLINTIGALALSAGFACAGPGEPEVLAPVVSSNLSTNNSAITTNTIPGGPYYGYLDMVKVDLNATASPTGTLKVATAGGQGLGESRTLLSVSVTADSVYFPREIQDTAAGVEISNEPTLQPIVAEDIQVWFESVNKTNIDATVYIVFRKEK